MTEPAINTLSYQPAIVVVHCRDCCTFAKVCTLAEWEAQGNQLLPHQRRAVLPFVHAHGDHDWDLDAVQLAPMPEG